ncbi:Uroporphyrinogen-III C-methyltransferase [Smittium mucronatum]|uniref:precorrin-2 dehydrogenase n=1 Tax=Smittium mucronatum TaxID=133383 RepID=A0A1R0H0L0_9FUNG|nr:Uroporphyrinogen-III C-methyltransferase [Smittium mucronatum]
MAIASKYPDPIGGGSFIVAYRAKNKNVLVIGGGEVAAGRVYNSLDSDMIVTVLSPKLNDELKYRHSKRQITWVEDIFQDHYLENMDMVLSTIDDPIESRRIVDLCNEKKIPVNAADINDLCDFWFMSMHRDGALQVAVATNSKAPRLANRLRRHIANTLPPGVGTAIDKIGQLRAKIKSGDPGAENVSKRMTWMKQLCDYWPIEELSKINPQDIDELFDSYIKQLDPKNVKISISEKSELPTSQVASDINADPVSAEKALEDEVPKSEDSEILESFSNLNIADSNDKSSDQKLENETDSVYMTDNPCKSRIDSNLNCKGEIYLIGAGLGEPDLLTVRAFDLLQKADLVLADKLIPEAVLKIVKTPDVFIARKFPGIADLAQQELYIRGLDALKAGKTVVRLKQGDSFVYGRGGEEILFFESHGFKCHVIPGLTSAIAGPGFNRIPLTHRGVADQILVLSGNNRFNTLPQVPPFLESRTLVFLMAIKKLNEVVSMLIDQDYPRSLPTAILENAGCSNQRKIVGTLESIVEIVQRLGTNPPGLLVIGHAINVLSSENLVDGLDLGYKDLISKQPTNECE